METQPKNQDNDQIAGLNPINAVKPLNRQYKASISVSVPIKVANRIRSESKAQNRTISAIVGPVVCAAFPPLQQPTDTIHQEAIKEAQ